MTIRGLLQLSVVRCESLARRTKNAACMDSELSRVKDPN
jgi:hypothetical protein